MNNVDNIVDNIDNILNKVSESNISNEFNKLDNENKKSYYCYILRNTYEKDINRTYNGYTVNPKNRIRQHNQEIKGGAIYTKKYGNKSWEIYVLIKGFPDNHCALQCEWRIKHPAKKKVRPAKYNSPVGRIIGLNEILHMDKWTSKASYNISDLNLEIWIINDYKNYLLDLPENIIVHYVDKIDLSIV